MDNQKVAVVAHFIDDGQFIVDAFKDVFAAGILQELAAVLDIETVGLFGGFIGVAEGEAAKNQLVEVGFFVFPFGDGKLGD